MAQTCVHRGSCVVCIRMEQTRTFFRRVSKGSNGFEKVKFASKQDVVWDRLASSSFLSFVYGLKPSLHTHPPTLGGDLETKGGSD